MTNFEKYKDEIMELCISDLKLTGGKFYLCNFDCFNCDFNFYCDFNVDGYEDYDESIHNSCDIEYTKWLYSEAD